MTTISIRELHQRTGAWVQKAAELGSIIVTERGRPIARLEAVEEHARRNPFLSRKLRPGYRRLMGTLTGGTDRDCRSALDACASRVAHAVNADVTPTLRPAQSSSA